MCLRWGWGNGEDLNVAGLFYVVARKSVKHRWHLPIKMGSVNQKNVIKLKSLEDSEWM